MRALFVARHNNDYDSLAPVVHAWAEAGNEALVYFPTPEIRWKDDYRTDILRRQPGIRFADIWDLGAPKPISIWLAKRWATVTAETRGTRKFLQLVTERVLAPRYESHLIGLLGAFRPQVVCCDWYSIPEKRARYGYFGYQTMRSWAKRNAVPLMALPHGLVLYDQPQAGEAAMRMYALMFVESQQRKVALERLGGHLCEIAVTGSPRYDPSWVERIAGELDRLYPTSRGTGDKVRIVYFGKKQVYDFDFAEQNRWLVHLASHPAVELVIQPHPRGQKKKDFAQLAGLPNVTIDPRTPATVLISRADMVSTLTSSVMVEAVVRGREILYPKFCNTVVTRFEEQGACISLEGIKDTFPAIDAYIAGNRVPKENYQAFLEQTAWGGQGPQTIDRIIQRMAVLAADE
ncbi:MAG: hypothetical protein KDJ66_14085 [Nitratireductor sp.]|nr:hypothetical protein [Nitratireductor sp.]